MPWCRWDESDGIVDCDEASAEFDIPQDQLAAYKSLLKMVEEVEARLRTQFSSLPDDLKALRGVLSDAEIQAIVQLRQGDQRVAVALIPNGTAYPEVSIQVVGDSVGTEPAPEAIPLTQEPRNCPNHRGKIHVPSKYGLLPDTRETKRVMAWCNCGHLFVHNVKCPHQNQGLPTNGRSGDIPCAWCGAIIIGGTGATGLDDAVKNKQTSLPPVNPDQFGGNA